MATEINQNIKSISDVGDETAEDARLSLERGEQLESLANRLSGLIGRFRVA